MKKEKINLLVTFDKNYIEPFKVMLKSLTISSSQIVTTECTVILICWNSFWKKLWNIAITIFNTNC